MRAELFTSPREGTRLLAILGIVGLIYAGALTGSFHFDDTHSLLENPAVRDLANLPQLFFDTQAFSRNEGSQMYRPLVLVSYMLTYQVAGYEPMAFLSVNWLIHLAVVASAYLLHRQIGLSLGRAMLAALLFGVHPIVAEPIHYVSARSESLAALGVVLSLTFFMRAGRGYAFLSLLFFACALMAKASAAVLPVVLMLYERSVRVQRWADMRWLRLAGFGFVLVGYLAFTRSLLSEALLEAPVRSLGEQLAVQSKAVLYYGKLLLGLQPQSVEHQFYVADQVGGAFTLSAVCLVSFLLLGGRWLWRYDRTAFFYAGWAFLALLPTLIVPLNMLVNERRLYVPLMACAALAAQWPLGCRRQGLLIAGLVSLTLFSALAVQRSAVWESEWALWQDARSKAPHAVRPHVKVGVLLRERGDYHGALRLYGQALTIDPEHAPALNNAGNAYRSLGDRVQAQAAYEQALALWPQYVDAMINLATLHSEAGAYAESNRLFQKALAIGSNRAELHNNLGTNYLRMGDYRSAEKALRAALELAHSSPRILFNLGGALEGMERYEEAREQFLGAIAMDSTYAGAYAKLGGLCQRAGDRDCARANYVSFLRHWRGEEAVAEDVRRRLRALSFERQ